MANLPEAHHLLTLLTKLFFNYSDKELNIISIL